MTEHPEAPTPEEPEESWEDIETDKQSEEAIQQLFALVEGKFYKKGKGKGKGEGKSKVKQTKIPQ